LRVGAKWLIMASKNGDAVGVFYIECKIANLRRSNQLTVPKMLVDSGSEFTWIPQTLLKQPGVRVERKDVPFLMANGQTVTRQPDTPSYVWKVLKPWMKSCLGRKVTSRCSAPILGRIWSIGRFTPQEVGGGWAISRGVI